MKLHPIPQGQCVGLGKFGLRCEKRPLRGITRCADHQRVEDWPEERQLAERRQQQFRAKFREYHRLPA